MGAVARARSVGAVLCTVLAALAADASTLTRDRDPVVMTGLDLPSFTGASVDRIVAFRYAGGWSQIPVQVDERDVLEYGDVYNGSYSGFSNLAYTDPTTYAGADSDPSFDDDDELVFMAADAGAQAPPEAGLPAGATPGSGLEIEISDLLDSGSGWVYLFETDGTLAPDAGVSYGTYTFDLLAGSYIPDYDTANGPNPEDSEFVSDLYRTHFSDRWIRDELQVTAGAATGVDILDRHKNMFAPGYCMRTEDTFSNGEGAFFANVNGPVRSIRSYMGANSGPLTQREHVFYRGRQDISTFLRVHEIPAIGDVYDYSPAASGMTYYNDLNPSGVTVDGSPDVLTAGAASWEMVTGPQGTVTSVVSSPIDTDVPGFAYTSYYSDDSTPSTTQCTGDAYEYATSGIWVTNPIPNTDPRSTPYYILAPVRIVYYDPPGRTVADAQLRHDQANSPLEVTTAPFAPPACSDGFDNDGDGLVDYPNDPGCGLAGSVREDPQCDDDFDNDGDGLIDWDGSGVGDPDPQCVDRAFVNNERPVGCGLGAELVLTLAPLFWLLGRADRRRGR